MGIAAGFEEHGLSRPAAKRDGDHSETGGEQTGLESDAAGDDRANQSAHDEQNRHDQQGRDGGCAEEQAAVKMGQFRHAEPTRGKSEDHPGDKHGDDDHRLRRRSARAAECAGAEDSFVDVR